MSLKMASAFDVLLSDRELMMIVISRLKKERLRTVARRYYVENLSYATIAHQMNLPMWKIMELRVRAYRRMCVIAHQLEDCDSVACGD